MVSKKRIHYLCEGGIEYKMRMGYTNLIGGALFFYPTLTLMIDSYNHSSPCCELLQPDLLKSQIRRIIISGPRNVKTCLWWFANNKGGDQPAHPRSLISTFIIHLLESIISMLARSKISFSNKSL